MKTIYFDNASLNENIKESVAYASAKMVPIPGLGLPSISNFVTDEISDGYHTFGELYDHRIRLFLALCATIFQYSPAEEEWKTWVSKNHSDGKPAFGGGWFVLGIGREKGEQITYHLPEKYWPEATRYAEQLERAPEFDGHSPGDVLERLTHLVFLK